MATLKRKQLLLIFLLTVSSKTIAAEKCSPYPMDQSLYDLYPYAILYYYGITGSDTVAAIFLHGQFHRWPEHLQSVEFEYTLDEQNWFRRLFNPLVGIVQLAANVAYRVGSNQNNIAEIDPYIGFRWANLPWNHYITTSFVAGEGISYVTSIPSVERNDNGNSKRLLNYMLLEATFAAPSYPRLQVVLRLHHRSGAYGLYHAGNSGSNNLGLGIRYLFD